MADEKKGKVLGKLVVVGGGSAKSMNVWDVDDSQGWTILGGETGEAKEAKDYFKKVPWLRRGVSIIATGVSQVPFTVQGWNKDSGTPQDKIVDDSASYQNKVKFLPNPKRLLWLVAASRQLTGRGYLFKGKNKFAVTKGLKYRVPTSINPEFSPDGEIKLWKRKFVNAAGKTDEKDIPLDEIIYSFYADPYIEVGPPANWPALAALEASGVLFNLDEAVSGFFKGGMMRQTIFTVPANTQKEERERVENVLTKTLMGVRNLANRIAKVFNADAFTATVVGDGLEGLESSSITESKREDIAAAFGIPMSKLFSTDAGGIGGGGVVEQDEQNFLRETLLPETEAIFEDLNEQVFHPSGYHIEINEQGIDAFQEDEGARSVAVQSLTSSLTTSPEAFELSASIMGYELTPEQVKMLEALKAAKAQQRESFTARLNADDKKPALNGNKPPEDPEELSKEAEAELKRWKRHALARGGEVSAVEFNNGALNDQLDAFIRECLKKCKSKDNVKSLFAAVRHMKLTKPLIAATKSALSKAKTADRVDGIFADLMVEMEHEH